MKVALYTPLPALSAELADVVRLFFGEISLSVNEGEGEADLCLRQELKEEEGAWDCAFSLGERRASRQAQIPRGPGTELLFKRVRKRLCKQTLYDLLKEESGIHPPWGSLTGIRPTRLVYEAMAQGRTLPQAAEYVRETFDVHPDKAETLKRIVETQLHLPPPDPGEADVYIGIPFCRTRCAYCSFLSGELGDGRLEEPYVAALDREMAFTARLMEEKGLKLRAVYGGGGTPTALSLQGFGGVLKAMHSYFPGAREYTVEAGRPDSITREKLQIIREAGAGRISINPQTMREETLKRIGRDHSPEQTVEAYALAREMGFDSINMDLIAGLPGETEEDFSYTLSWFRRLKPESLTVHTLALKRASLLRLWEWPLPDGGQTARMVRSGAEAAHQMGLSPYYLYRQKYMAGNQENVGYALPGHECLYNVDIMEEAVSILAVGAGAISKRIFGGEGRIQRAPNVSDIPAYIAREEEMEARKRTLWE